MASGYSDLSEIRKNDTSGGYYGLSQKPPKINLINERPRRESVVERQLATNLAPTHIGQPTQQVQQQVHFSINSNNLDTAVSYHNYGQPSRSQASVVAPLDDVLYHSQAPGYSETTTTTRVAHTQQQQQNQQPSRQQQEQSLRAYSELVDDLAQKEAKLRREMAYLNQQASPWARPRQIRAPRQEPEPRRVRANSQQRWLKECPPSPSFSSRPNSRASSTRSNNNTEADLMEKTSQLLKDAVEIEKKQLKTQEILIESGASSTQPSRSPTVGGGVSSIHTAIIRVPRQEIDNKSPLPFAYDNFSTLGVRGNIASVGAAPPDSPYPPIFPVVKRTNNNTSPTNRMY